MVFVITATPANTTQAQVQSFARTGKRWREWRWRSRSSVFHQRVAHDKTRESRAVVPHSNRKAEPLDDPAHLSGPPRWCSSSNQSPVASSGTGLFAVLSDGERQVIFSFWMPRQFIEGPHRHRLGFLIGGRM